MSTRLDQLLDAVGDARDAGGGTSRGAGSRHVFAVALRLVLLLALLGAVGFGTSVYQRLNERSDAAEQARSPLGVIVNAVRATDAVGSVSGRRTGGRRARLVERLASGTYETRFFLSDGWLVEQYAVAGSPYDADAATRLAESSSFSFEEDDGLLTVSCDAGSARVALRSQTEGVAT